MHHWSKILKARPRIDNDGTDLPGLLIKQSVRNKKTIQIDEERNTEIERENRILLEKITKILKNKQHCPKDAAVNFETEGRSRSQMHSNKQNVYRSMKRIKEKQRISDENQKILDRLISQRSQFDRNQIKKDEQRHQQLLSNLTHFPKPMYNPIFSSRRLSPSPKPIMKHTQSQLGQMVHQKRGSLSPIIAEEDIVSNFLIESLQLSQSNELTQMNNTQQLDNAKQFDTSTSLQTETIGMPHPYESLEKKEFEKGILQNKKNSDIKNHSQSGRQFTLLQLPLEKLQGAKYRTQKRPQPIQSINQGVGIQIKDPILTTQLKEPAILSHPKRSQILISEQDYYQQESSQQTHMRDTKNQIMKATNVQALINRQDLGENFQKPYESTRQRSLSPQQQHKDLKQAIKDYIIKNANNRYHSRLKHRKSGGQVKHNPHQHITPLKVWGLQDSTNSFTSSSASNNNLVGHNNHHSLNESIEQRAVIYQKSRKIEGVWMTVEVSYTRHKVYITCIEHENMRQHVIQMYRKQAEYLIEQTDLKKLEKLQSYAKLLKMLEFRFGRLILNENKQIKLNSQKPLQQEE